MKHFKLLSIALLLFLYASSNTALAAGALLGDLADSVFSSSADKKKNAPTGKTYSASNLKKEEFINTDGKKIVDATKYHHNITVDENESLVFHSPVDVGEVFIVNHSVADIRMIDQNDFYVFGLAPGETRIYVTPDKKQRKKKQTTKATIHEITVLVHYPVKKLKRLIDETMPGNSIEVKSIRKGILVEGNIESTSDADVVIKMAKQFLKDDAELINNLKVSTSSQVSLQVKIAEVNRNALNKFNFDWSGSINGSIDGKTMRLALSEKGKATERVLKNGFGAFKDMTTAIDFLETENQATILAEPMLTTLSGVEANFKIGGEFPIIKSETTTNNNNNTATQSTEFIPFGTELSFTPTVIGDNIHLTLKINISDRDDSRSVTVSNSLVPGKIEKSTETSVILGDSQSLMIAGIITKNKTIGSSGFPGLKDIPLVGGIFGSANDTESGRELIIMVTPTRVTPIQANKDIKLPTELVSFAPVSDAFLFGKIMRKNAQPLPKAFQAGFFYGDN